MTKQDEKDIINDMLRTTDKINPASVDLGTCLNEIIKHHGLSAQEALTILARVCAGYIQTMQKAIDDPGWKNYVEEDFDLMLTLFKVGGDIPQIHAEMEKMRHELFN